MSELLMHNAEFVVVVFAYLCGSIPFGFWFAKQVKGKNFDIRDWGSGNIGFTNVKGVLGWKVAIPVLIFDTLKGFVPVVIANAFFGEGYAAICLIFSAVGHSYSLYFYWKEGVFSGGKAVATLFGGVLAIHPVVAITALIVWFIVLKKTDYMSVASMLAGISTIFSSWGLGLNAYRIGLFVLVSLLIVYRHARNIGRLIHHIEPKFSEKRGAHNVGDEVVVAFAIHSRDEYDLLQSPLSSWIIKLLKRGIISKRTVRRIVRYGRIIECGETLDTTEQGVKVRTIYLAVPLMPDQIDQNPKLAQAFLMRATVIAQRRGARVFGLGGLLSTVFKDVKEEDRLDAWARNRGFTIHCDNGAAFTAAATLIALEKTLDRKGLDTEELVAAVIGAKGAIGFPVYDALRKDNNFKDLFAVLRDKRAKSSDAIVLEKVIQTDEIDKLATADIIISCTSSPKAIFNVENHSTIKEEAIFLDVAFPPDFDRAILEIRDDITLIACGLILLPGEFELPIDIHFGTVCINGIERSLIPACLAQCILIGITERYEFATLGAAKRESIKFLAEQSFVHGFKVIESSLTEQDIYAGIAR